MLLQAYCIYSWKKANLVEEELKLLIGQVDTQLFKTICIKLLKTEDIKDS